MIFFDRSVRFKNLDLKVSDWLLKNFYQGVIHKGRPQVGGGGSDLFSKVYIGQRGEGVKYWQNSAEVLYGWPQCINSIYRGPTGVDWPCNALKKTLS